MTDPNFTAITVLLDRSGSMKKIDEGTCTGFNAFIDEQKKDGGRCTVSLIRFDAPGFWERQGSSEEGGGAGPWFAKDYTELDVKDVPVLKTVGPRGNTALHYALIKAIEETGAHYNAMAEHLRPGKVVFVVITDGEENASPVEFNAAKVKAAVEHQRHKYNWQFVFLGANQDAVTNGANMGFSMANSSTYAADDVHVKHAFCATAGVLRSYRSAAPDAQLCAFSAAQRADMGGDAGVSIVNPNCAAKATIGADPVVHKLFELGSPQAFDVHASGAVTPAKP